ncbi:MAG: GNAT family protein [Candidatus Nanohaloarchaea archaeon]|nr:GNAT family protein [Candidatus Nanohaloarchaea archaeon]
MAFLTTERLEIDPLETEQASEVAAINHSDGMQQYGGLRKPSSVDDVEEWIEETDDLLFGLWRDDTFIGYVGVHQDNEVSRTEEIFAYLRDDEQGKGYGPEAVHRVIRYCFDEMNMHKIVGRAFEHNDPSQKMLERLGFQHEGTFRNELYKQGEYRDVERYGLLRGELQEPE